MLTLAATQSSTWGYSYYNHPSFINAIGSSSNYVGSFTKPTLAPNGNMYAILVGGTSTINGVTNAFTILKITPGTTNTATTNFTPASFSYIYADNTVSADAGGFAKPTWGAPANLSAGGSATDNSMTRFNTGILASNGLIYFPPIQCGSCSTTANDWANYTNKWVVFNPISDKWKVLNLHPSVSITNGVPNGYINAAVLGSDNKLYVFPGGAAVPIYRITTTTNASGDAIETGYWASLTTSPLNNTNMQWNSSAGTSYTDTASVSSGFTKAVDFGIGSTQNGRVNSFSDLIPHPNGNIYIIPSRSRGRIFYIKTSAFTTSLGLVSETGLHTSQVYSGTNKEFHGYYGIVEKPRNADHNINTLKIYLIPRIAGGTVSANICNDVLCLDPVTNTLSIINLGFLNTVSGSAITGLSKKITLANGLSLMYNRATANIAGGSVASTATTHHGCNIFTGWDVSTSVSNGAIAADRGASSIFTNFANTIYPATSLEYLTTTAPSQISTGGGNNAAYPHHSKFITFSNPTATERNVVEVVSIKEYGDGITYFNFTDRDKPSVAPPVNIGGLALSLFNMNHNKPK
jgi:hypothetical protein